MAEPRRATSELARAERRAQLGAVAGAPPFFVTVTATGPRNLLTLYLLSHLGF